MSVIAIGAASRPIMVNIQDLFDDAKCFQTVRDMRRPDGVACPSCGSASVVKNGRDDTQPDRQRYECKDCRKRFDDLSGTVFAGHHLSLRAWIACLYLMGLNLSGLQIARELGIDKSDARDMITTLRQGIVDRTPMEELSGEVECDEVYVVAGHKGHPEAVQKDGRVGRRRRLEGSPSRGTLEKEKPPIFGMLRRGRRVVIRMLANVRQATIRPLIEATIAPGTLIHTDEYDIYSRLEGWGYRHKTVCHGRGEYARDEDGDGFHEVHVNTLEGFWSLLRSWLRPHRGIPQESLPLYLAFFQFVHNVRARGKALLGALITQLVASPRNPS